MKNKFKNQDGVISVFAMLAMLFFLLFTLGAYMAVSRSNRTQKESNDEIMKIYSTEVNAQDVYDEMITSAFDTKPLYTYDDINRLGTNSFYAINGKVYDFKLLKYGLGELKTNLNVMGITDEYYKKNGIYYSTSIDAGIYKYVEGNSLKVSLDGTNNSGEGFSENIATWNNLVTKNPNSRKFNIYNGSKKVLKEGEPNWTGKGLAVNDIGSFILCNNVLPSGNSSETLEIVFKIYDSKNQRLLGSWGKASGGGLSIVGTGLRGEFFLESDVYKSNTVDNKIQPDKVCYVALTYDGNKIKLYKNGRCISNDTNNKDSISKTETITYKTSNTVSSTVQGDSRKVRLGINASISNVSSNSSAKGILLSPYTYPLDATEYNSYIKPDFRIGPRGSSLSTVYVKDSNGNIKSTSGTTYSHNNISDLKDVKKIKFSYALSAMTKNGPVNVSCIFDYSNNLKVGNNDNNSSFSVIATGTDSVVIKSNVGKIQTWYFDGVEKSSNTEVEILGEYYYAFDNLTPNTEYEIYASFKNNSDSNKINIKSVANEYNNSIFIGNSYVDDFNEEKFEGFNGIIYAVRVYDKALTSDQILTNYKIDKSRFSITDY